VAKGNIGFALLKQSGIIANFATIGSHPAISGALGLLVAQPNSTLSVAITLRASV
jgi:hypothetical protein